MLVFLFFFIKNKREEKKEKKLRESYLKSIISTNFTKPEGFGYKLPYGWMAVKTDDYKKVANYFSLKNQYSTNWQQGIKYGYDGGTFITPAFFGWTFVISPGFFLDSLFKNESLINKLKKMSIEFGEINCYTSYRIVGQNSWVKFNNGGILRAFSINNDIVFDFGFRTEIENSLISQKRIELLKDKEILDFEIPENEMEYFGDEEDVFKVSGSWDVNPQDLYKINIVDERLGIFIYGKNVFS